MLAAAITSAASNAHPNESTLKSPGASCETSSRIRASTISTAKNPMININGSRSAATSGGNTAFSTPINAAASSAPRNVLTSTPGRITPDTTTATAPTSSASTTRSGRKRGRAAFHCTVSAYVASETSAITRPRPAPGPAGNPIPKGSSVAGAGEVSSAADRAVAVLPFASAAAGAGVVATASCVADGVGVHDLGWRSVGREQFGHRPHRFLYVMEEELEGRAEVVQARLAVGGVG